MADNWKLALACIVTLLGVGLISVLPPLLFDFLSRDLIFIIWFIFAFIVMYKLAS